MAGAYEESKEGKSLGKPLFVQISDTHIGFHKAANPDVSGTLARTIDIVNGMPERPALIIPELHTVPGEHDTADATVTEYFSRFGKASGNRGHYSFDHAGVHFLALVNVLQFEPGGLGTLGQE